MNILSIKNLNFKYKNKYIFKDFNATFKPGLHYILGENGSGKSTLIKILATLLVPQKGEITLSGINYDKVMEIKKSISYIPQEFDIYPMLTVEEFLTFILNLKGIKNPKKLIVGQLDKFNLVEFKKEKMKNLSSGTKKRVAIAQALAVPPMMILADEPTAGLDPGKREDFNDMIEEIERTYQDIIILYTTHILDDIRDDGKISMKLDVR